MSKLLERARVIASAAVTYLTLIAAAVPFIAAEIAKVAPGQAEEITKYALAAVGWLTAAVAIIRRVTPVPAEQRGVLPPDGPHEDRGDISIGTIVIVVVVVLAAVFVLKELGWLN